MTTSTDPALPERVLLLGDDGSAGADVAWLWVCNHAWPGWRAEVVTATMPPLPPPVKSEIGPAVEWESPHPRLALPQSELGSIRSLTVERDPRLALSDRDDADLLVVGPHNQNRFWAQLLGSTTEWLLHQPPAPMAVIRSATPTRRVVVCADGSIHARAALDAFVALPWAKQTEVLVLGVADGWSRPEAGVEAALKVLAEAGISATSLVARGKPSHQILTHIEEHGTQLVVLGTRGLTGWERLRLGSTAGAVVRAADCSCLVAGIDQT